MACADASPTLATLDGRGWACIDWVSDLHLQAQEPRTAHAFIDYLANTPAQALFILGDLFEVWVGDDVLHDPSGEFERRCVQALAQAAQRMALFWLPGNRDFLTGPEFVSAIGARALAENCVLQTGTEVCLLCHGDDLCLQDAEYMAFRRQVRGADWQNAFLARPLAERQSLARQMREQSRMRQKNLAQWVDVDADAALHILREHGATRLIHGHTHQPADHELGPGLCRTVLSDWCMDGTPARGQILRWQAGSTPVWARLPVISAERP